MPLPLERQVRRCRKLLATVRRRRWWGALRRGVAPSLELAGVEFALAHRTVIDVGAGRGQFALFARSRFPEAGVYALEPGRASFGTLQQVHEGDARVHPIRVAAAATAGTGTLHLTADADSSSLFALDQQHRVFTGTDEVGTEQVATAPLDDVLPAEWPRPALLKIDVQGAEIEVLRGAARTLAAVDEILVEVSFRPLYRNQARADEVVGYLLERGFAVTAEYPAGRDARGRVVQSDVLLTRVAMA